MKSAHRRRTNRTRRLLVVAVALGVAGQVLPGAPAAATDTDSKVLWWKAAGQQDLDPQIPVPLSYWRDFDGLPGDELLVSGLPQAGIRVESRDAAQIWQYPESGMLPRIDALPAGDLSGDGVADVVAVGSGELMTFDGPTGAKLSKVDMSDLPVLAKLWRADHDLDGDGLADVLLWAQEAYDYPGGGTGKVMRTVEVALSGLDLSPLWEYRVQPSNEEAAATLGGGAIGDIDGDGSPEIAHFTGADCPDRPRQAVLIDGRTGALRWSTTISQSLKPWSLALGQNRVVITAAAVRAADCSTPKVLLQLTDPRPVALVMPVVLKFQPPPAMVNQLLLAYEATRGDLAWSSPAPGPPGQYLNQNLFVEDLDGDGDQEVAIAASQLGSERSNYDMEIDVPGNPVLVNGWLNGVPNTHPDGIHVYDLASGAPVWTHKPDVGGRRVQMALIPRPEGGADIAYATLNDVVVLAGSTGSVVWRKRFSEAPADVTYSLPYFAVCMTQVNGCYGAPGWGSGGPHEPLRDRPIGYSSAVARVESQDLNGDGISEVAIQGAMGWRRGFSRADGSPTWALSSLAGWTTATPGPGGAAPDVFAGDRGGGVSGMTQEGRRIWTTVLGSSVSALSYDAGRVLAITSQRTDTWRDSEVAALDALTGRVLWRTPTGNLQTFGRTPHTFADLNEDGTVDAIVGGWDEDGSGVQLFTSSSITAVDGATGEILWERVLPTGAQENGGRVCYVQTIGLTFTSGVVVAKTVAWMAQTGTLCNPFAEPIAEPRLEASYHGLDGRSGEFSWGPKPATLDWVRHLTPTSDGNVLEVGWTGSGYVISERSPLNGDLLWASDEITGDFWELLPVVSEDEVVIVRGDLGDGSAHFGATFLDDSGGLRHVEDETLPAAWTATVTKDGRLIYSSLEGVFVLPLDALKDRDVRVADQFRLPARFSAGESGGIDNPLVDELLTFGPGDRFVLGYATLASQSTWSETWPNAAWVAHLD